MNHAKPITRSKTVWFNVLVAVLAAIEAQAPVLKPVLGEATYAWLMFSAAMGNVILRAVTKEPVALPGTRP